MGIGAAIAGSSLLSGAGSIFGGIMGAGAQSDAARAAMKNERAMYEEGRGDLSPFMGFGAQAGNQLMSMLNGPSGGAWGTNSLLAPFNPTMSQLEQTPGYQFSLKQGLNSTENSYAARGLGSSGNALRGAANYAEGLAGTTFQNQFQDYQQMQQQRYNMLALPMNLGEDAAKASAGNAMTLGNMLGQNQMAIGNAQAGMWNNIGAGIGAIGSAPLGAMMGSQQYGMLNAQTNLMNAQAQAYGGYNQSGTWGATMPPDTYAGYGVMQPQYLPGGG